MLSLGMLASLPWVLAGIAAAAYFIESIFGFGGTILFLMLASGHADFSMLLVLATLASMLASLMILAQSIRHVAWKLVMRMLLLSAPGILLGTLLVTRLDHPILLQIFAVILVLSGLQGLINPDWQIPKMCRLMLIVAGGVIQGLFATGGPLILLGMRDHFAGKHALRASMAAFFLLSNLWRVVQLNLQGQVFGPIIYDYALLLPAVLFGIILGYPLHLRVSPRYFRYGISLIFIMAGLAFLWR